MSRNIVWLCIFRMCGVGPDDTVEVRHGNSQDLARREGNLSLIPKISVERLISPRKMGNKWSSEDVVDWLAAHMLFKTSVGKPDNLFVLGKVS